MPEPLACSSNKPSMGLYHNEAESQVAMKWQLGVELGYVGIDPILKIIALSPLRYTGATEELCRVAV